MILHNTHGNVILLMEILAWKCYLAHGNIIMECYLTQRNVILLMGLLSYNIT